MLFFSLSGLNSFIMKVPINQPIDFFYKATDYFLYDKDLHYERVKASNEYTDLRLNNG